MKKNYSAPQLEQVKMEAEMPVMQTSGTPGGNVMKMVRNPGIW